MDFFCIRAYLIAVATFHKRGTSCTNARQNLGTETAFSVLARAAELAAQGRDIINLGIGQPDFPTPPHIVEAAIKALRDGQHGYTPAKGIPPLREAVAADLHNRYGVAVNPDLVQILPGGKVVIFFRYAIIRRGGGGNYLPRSGLSDLCLCHWV